MNSFKVLLVGDIYAKPGRKALKTYLPKLVSKYSPVAVIVNAENAAHGYGLRPNMVKDFLNIGADVLTTGNHIWDHKDIVGTISEEKKLLRPANYPDCQPGKGVIDISITVSGNEIIIRVINLAGRIGMNDADCPFIAADNLIGKGTPKEQQLSAIIIDFHAEATSEKAALAHYLDGRCTAVVGTHTHVPTADNRVFPKGTAFMSDLGMTGNYDSVIGMKSEHAIKRFLGIVPRTRSEPADGEGILCGALLNISMESGLCLSIDPVRMGQSLEELLP